MYKQQIADLKSQIAAACATMTDAEIAAFRDTFRADSQHDAICRIACKTALRKRGVFLPAYTVTELAATPDIVALFA